MLSKVVEVNNWGSFLLQELFTFYTNRKQCDLTLMCNKEQFNVHRAVVCASSEYFRNIKKNAEIIVLPNDVSVTALKQLISFMYTGKMEICDDNRSELISLLKLIKIPVLSELIKETQFEEEEDEEDYTKIENTTLSIDPLSLSSRRSQRNIYKVSPKKRTKKPIVYGVKPVSVIDSLKLSVLKPRPGICCTNYNATKMNEITKPLRFELPEAKKKKFYYSNFDAISYESEPIMKEIELYSDYSMQSMTERSNNTDESNSEKESNTKEPSRDKLICVANDTIPYIFNNSAAVEEYEDHMGWDDGVEIKSECEDNYDDTPSNNVDDSSNTPKLSVRSTNNKMYSKASKTQKAMVNGNDTIKIELQNLEKSNEMDNKTIVLNTSEIKNLSNHSDLIQTVIEKFPALAANKRLCLKINTTDLKSDAMKPLFTVNKNGQVEFKNVKNIRKIETVSTTIPLNSKRSKLSVENIIGPWECADCGTPGKPVKLENYHSYRLHMHKAHKIKSNGEYCEYCGFRANRKISQLYHLYVKHHVKPPPNVRFPKCKHCDYIALTKQIFDKHMEHHHYSKSPNSNNSSKRKYRCTICNISLDRMINLKAHVRINHKRLLPKLMEIKEFKDGVLEIKREGVDITTNRKMKC